MKNFPHQINNLDRLTRALDVFSKGGPAIVLDDSELGILLARNGAYEFRNKKLGLKKALELEKKKPRASRGTETAARDLRRFFGLLGFIRKSGAVSKAGKNLLNVSGEARLGLWRNALRKVELDADGGISNPYAILLRLVNENPGMSKEMLFLALEAKDNSEKEYVRISKYIKEPLKDVIKALGLTEPGVRNALKILPSLALQLGDIKQLEERVFPNAPPLLATEEGIDLDANVSVTQGSKAALKPKSRKATVADIAPQPAPNVDDAADNFVNLAEANRQRKARLIRHQNVVTALAKLYADNGCQLFAGVFDCVALGSTAERAILIEVKTLDGTAIDEVQQVMKGVGQLLKYEHFDLPAEVKGIALSKAMAFDRRPSDLTMGFLDALGILILWPAADGAWQSGEAGLLSGQL